MVLEVLRKPRDFVETVLKFYDNATTHVKELFTEGCGETNMPSKDFQRAVDNACKTVVNIKDPNIQGKHNVPASTLLAQFCDMVLKEKNKELDYYMTQLDMAVKVFNH